MYRIMLVSALALIGEPAITNEAHAVSSAQRALHERLIVLDAHLDTPTHFGRFGWDITQRHSYATDLSQVDYPRMVEGGLDGGFFVIYTGQGPLTPAGYAAAHAHALKRAENIRKMVAAHPDKLELARSAADAGRIAAAGRRGVYQSIENSYPLGEDLSRLTTFQALGIRMAGPVHFKNNQFSDSATDKPRWHGLSPLGKQWVAEMNRLGMVIDGSHASDEAFDQMLALSKTPIILSHSGSRTIYDHPRNLDDARIRKLAAAGGVIQVTSVYLAPSPSNDVRDALLEQFDVIDTLPPAEQAKLLASITVLDEREPPVLPTFEAFMASLLHALKVAGVDHVGIGADWDGGGGLAGLPDIAALPKITAELREAGYSEADIAKIWSGNVLRVLRQAEDYARSVDRSPH